jgi:DNA-binding LytR/AlgR family response regulator
MSSVRVVVVEDEPVIAADLCVLLSDLGHVVVATCRDARSAMLALGKHMPELLLLDINLGRGADGVRIAEEVNAVRPTPFLFVTSHTDQATLERVKRVRPAGFIIKPFDAEDLRTQIEIALARYAASTPADAQPAEEQQQDFVIDGSLFVRDKGRLVKVAIDDVIYAEADGNYVTLHTAERRFVLTAALSAIEEKLASPWFMRVHRGYLVDLRRITGVEEKRVLLGSIPIPVGRTHRELLKKRLDLT